MLKKLLTFFVFAGILVAGMIFASPVAAFNGVSGIIIDSKENLPWQHGAEIWVYNVQEGTICATAVLPTGTGSFNIPLDGTLDALGVGGVATCIGGSNLGDTIEVYIDFQCQQSVGTCNTQFPPAPADASYTFVQNSIPTTRNAGYIETLTGPTAVTLDTVSASSNTGLIAVAAGLMMLLGAGTFVAARRRS